MARRKVTRGSPPRLARSRPRAWSPTTGAATARSNEPAAREERPAKPRDKEDEVSAGRVSSDEAPNFLGVYFREMAGLGVMSPEEELSIATRIAQLRRTYWSALFSYPPFIDPIAQIGRAHV